MGTTCSTHGEKGHAYRGLVGKLEEKRAVGRPTHRWEDNIKMDFRKVEWGGVHWIHLIQDSD
jgi:hypothetical protein